MQNGMSQRATPRMGMVLVMETDIALSGLGVSAQQRASVGN